MTSKEFSVPSRTKSRQEIEKVENWERCKAVPGPVFPKVALGMHRKFLGNRNPFSFPDGSCLKYRTYGETGSQLDWSKPLFNLKEEALDEQFGTSAFEPTLPNPDLKKKLPLTGLVNSSSDWLLIAIDIDNKPCIKENPAADLNAYTNFQMLRFPHSIATSPSGGQKAFILVCVEGFTDRYPELKNKNELCKRVLSSAKVRYHMAADSKTTLGELSFNHEAGNDDFEGADGRWSNLIPESLKEFVDVNGQAMSVSYVTADILHTIKQTLAFAPIHYLTVDADEQGRKPSPTEQIVIRTCRTQIADGKSTPGDYSSSRLHPRTKLDITAVACCSPVVRKDSGDIKTIQQTTIQNNVFHAPEVAKIGTFYATPESHIEPLGKATTNPLKKKFLQVLSAHMGLLDGAQLSTKLLSEALGVSISTISKWLQALQNDNLLECTSSSYVPAIRAKSYIAKNKLKDLILEWSRLDPRGSGPLPKSIQNGEWYETELRALWHFDSVDSFMDWHHSLPGALEKGRAERALGMAKCHFDKNTSVRRVTNGPTTETVRPAELVERPVPDKNRTSFVEHFINCAKKLNSPLREPHVRDNTKPSDEVHPISTKPDEQRVRGNVFKTGSTWTHSGYSNRLAGNEPERTKTSSFRRCFERQHPGSIRAAGKG